MTSVESPRVSVIITAYNREAFVGDAIRSAMRSTMRDIEIIVVDDASADGTAGVARAIASTDERVQVFVNETNLGDYPNRNRAAAYAKGEFIKYVDSDDFIYPYALEVMLSCMRAFPEAGLGLSAWPDPDGPAPRRLSPVEAYRAHFFKRDLLGRSPGSAIIRRSCFEAVGGFSGQRQVGDRELWLRIARRFPVVKMPMDLVWDREHPEQQKKYDTEVDKSIMHDEVERLALEAADCPLSASERDEALARVERRRLRGYWRFLRSRGVRAAEEYRRKAALPLRSTIAAALPFSS